MPGRRRPTGRRSRSWFAALALLGCAQAKAQQAPDTAPLQLPPITIVGASPLLGSGVDRDTVPAEASVLYAPDLTRGDTASPDAVAALNEQVGGVNLSSASGNPYQPTLLYHGFAASGLQGTPQGLAVYVNGVRFNQAFGDTVNFDLLPNVAINEMNLEGSNPVFGLNALGGAVNVRLKDGFDWHGTEIEMGGGSFGTYSGSVQFGKQSRNTAIYVAASGLHESGWRQAQSSDIENFYGDVGWRGERGEAHLDMLAAHSLLNGPGTSPIELLAADPTAQFTVPDRIFNTFVQISLTGNAQVSDMVSIQALGYYNNFLQRVNNTNGPNDTPCVDDPTLLCIGTGGVSTTFGGVAIPAFRGSNPLAYAELDNQTTNTNGYGASIQATDTHDLFGHRNHLVVGLSFDGSQTAFTAASFVGGVDSTARVFLTPDVIIDEPDINQPVRVSIANTSYGVFAADTFNISDKLAATLSGRFNAATVDLKDRNGGDLSGNHAYSRFNPAAGISYRVTPWLSVYAGYAEANRAPTPAELSCAGPTASCSLANFFVADPDLKQVTVHTVETGLRGATPIGSDGHLSYNVGLFRSILDDDIVFVTSPTLNRAFFANVGQTRRQGVDVGIQYRAPSWSGYIDYSYTAATFQTRFVESAGNNPAGDANGNITVLAGNRLPGVPSHQLKFGVTWRVTNRWTVAATAVFQSSTFLVGDDANLTAPLPAFLTANLSTSYQVTPNVQLFGAADNITNARYYTYGAFSPTSSIFLAPAPKAINPRSYSPAAPIGGFGGVRIRF